jgi:hypothetical protein
MSSPTEVQVITEIDVYEASVRKVVSRGNLNASPLAEPSYSWSDVEEQTEAEKPKVEEPKVQPKVEEPKVQPKVEEPKVQPKVEEPKVQLKVKEEPDLTESENKRLDKLITDIIHSDSNIKIDVELESDEDMSDISELIDSPKLDETDSDMPDLVSESDSEDEMPGLVSDTESEVDDDLMIAVFKRPSCPRCEAALKILMAHEENADTEEPEEEHMYDDPDDSVTTDDSDSDYVPSETESERESPRTLRQLRRWNAERAETTQNREPFVPAFIQFIAIVLFVVHILKFLLNEPSHRVRCYS